MRIINLKVARKGNKADYITKNRMSHVSLGNGVTVYFSNINTAASYTAKVNRMLTEALIEINDIYIEIWSEYRKLYLIYHKYLVNQQSIIEHNNEIQRLIDLLLHRNRLANGGQFAFLWIFEIIENIHDIADILNKHLRNKKKAYHTFPLKIGMKRLNHIKKDLEAIGKEQKNIEIKDPLL